HRWPGAVRRDPRRAAPCPHRSRRADARPQAPVDRSPHSASPLMLTVRDLLADVDVRLLAGDAGLDLPVRWVHISELEDPTPWLSGGEVLLTTGMQLGDESRQHEFINRLADHQLAALGFGTGFGHDEVPTAI